MHTLQPKKGGSRIRRQTHDSKNMEEINYISISNNQVIKIKRADAV